MTKKLLESPLQSRLCEWKKKTNGHRRFKVVGTKRKMTWLQLELAYMKDTEQAVCWCRVVKRKSKKMGTWRTRYNRHTWTSSDNFTPTGYLYAH